MAVTGKDLPDIKNNSHSIHSNPDMIRFTTVTCSEYSVIHDCIQDYKKARAAMNRFTTGEDGIFTYEFYKECTGRTSTLKSVQIFLWPGPAQTM